VNGFVQLRRGLLEHVESGRMTSDEFAAFVYITAKADHRTGVWKGSGRELGAALGWCPRQGQNVLASLKSKTYVKVFRTRFAHGSSFSVAVPKYHTHPGASRSVSGAPRCVSVADQAHPGAPLLQEVNLQEWENKKNSLSSVPKSRKQQETESELRAGTGPQPYPRSAERRQANG
jgi:hypothetical protein